MIKFWQTFRAWLGYKIVKRSSFEEMRAEDRVRLMRMGYLIVD